jgi:hypothetical protein
MCTAEMYGHPTDTASCIDTGTNIKYWTVPQLIDSEYQELQQHFLIPDRFFQRISNPICTATARRSIKIRVLRMISGAKMER